MLEVLNAPWTTVLTLASGYAGYFVAHVGNRDHHTAMDQVFRVIFYGFWGMFAFVMSQAKFGLGIFSASAAAMTVAALIGASWRQWGRLALEWILRGSRISFSDDLTNAWSAIGHVGERAKATQLVVYLTDGTALMCDDLSKFRDHPNGPCVFGGAGDILIYATASGRKDETGRLIWKERADVIDEEHGSMQTYVPAANILKVSLRRSKK